MKTSWGKIEADQSTISARRKFMPGSQAFFLGWQTRSEQGLFQGGEIGQWITAEAKQTATAVVAIVEAQTQGTPSGDIGKLQISRADGVEVTEPSSHHAYGAAHHQGW